MRQILLSLTLAIAISSVAMAQPKRKPSTRILYITESPTTSVAAMQTTQQQQSYENYFSFRAGVNFADLVDPHYTSNSQTGFNAALLYNISLSEYMPIYLQTGLGLEMKGARSSNVLENVGRSHFKSYWVELPAVITYDIPVSAHAAIVPEFGVYYAFAFEGSLEGDGEFYRPYEKQDIEIEGEGIVESRLFRRSDFGLRMGLSVKMSKMMVGFAYEAGLLNTFAEDIRVTGSQLTTGCWSLNLQYLFK